MLFQRIVDFHYLLFATDATGFEQVHYTEGYEVEAGLDYFRVEVLTD